MSISTSRSSWENLLHFTVQHYSPYNSRGKYALSGSQVSSKIPPTFMTKKNVSCAVETTLAVIGGRWKVLILQQLFDGVKRFNDLHRALSGITHKTLTQQ